jgi:hypothetical protein
VIVRDAADEMDRGTACRRHRRFCEIDRELFSVFYRFRRVDVQPVQGVEGRSRDPYASPEFLDAKSDRA